MYISSASAAVMPLQLDQQKAANSSILHTQIPVKKKKWVSQTTWEDTLEMLPRNAEHKANFQHWDHYQQGGKIY